MTLVEEALKATLEPMDLETHKWLRESGKYPTWILKPGDSLRREIALSKTEEPILEYASDNAYSLITTDRIISILEGVFHEADFKNVSTVRPLITTRHVEEELPRDILRVVLHNNEEFLIKFDRENWRSVYFARMLATNLIWKIQKGKFYRYRYDD